MSSQQHSPAEHGTDSQHVLVIGIDGVRFDTLQELSTPTIEAIGDAGFLAPVRVNEAGPTISGPSWASVFTGVFADRHNIANNQFDGHRLTEFPDVLHLAQAHRPGLPVFVGAAWPPLVGEVSGGPLFAEGGFRPDPEAGDWGAQDELVADAAEQFIAGHAGHLGSIVVCYLGAPDEVAHADGVGPTYRKAITDSDARAGRLVDAVRARQGEEWTVIAVTDHGHVDAGGHGGDTDEERTAWIAAAGPGISGAPDGLEQADVAAHTMATLQIAEPAWAHMSGRPFGKIRNG
ncbi:alkaline phosphatase family protein [Microlunatus soli]|uniref:Type I phosphodiesterase / nucleotide pyrophosphatase n=1 Tax=Microlunatus soli TaxID=630515 RepID=A0A1H1WHH7_9ACTN|nr:alkaline phosphatase family protein [Microlunatus soli]SDS96544.1 Type I phosphodiesterase / nucleotide pyrophosphatase [Microlunatus soli]